MDTPFDVALWQPTRPRAPGDTRLSPHALHQLSENLANQTREIRRYPYDPQGWIIRSETLRQLRYPELALGDAHKAMLLCERHLQRLSADVKGQWRLGCGMGFWMRDDAEPDRSGMRDRLLGLQEQALQCEAYNVLVPGVGAKGKFHPRPYPWLSQERSRRSDGLVDLLNAEFAASAWDPLCAGSFCELRRHAFGNTGPRSRDVLGVFATRDIPSKTTVLVDKTRIWGCNGPGSDGTLDNLFGGSGCGDPIHPNSPDDDVGLDLRWIRDETGKNASNVLLMCRIFLAAIQDAGVGRNPLDHPLVQRLTPTYRYDDAAVRPETYHLHTDFDIPLRALQQFGVDIFADFLAWETWILFTVFARVENNSCGCLLSESLMPLFSLFNHSCEPNLEWVRPRGGEGHNNNRLNEDEDGEPWFNEQAPEEGVDHSTIVVSTVRDVQAGEQLFVEYDSFVAANGVWERRERLRKWLAGDCQCGRCVREAVGAGPRGPGSRVSSGSSAASSWDDGERVALPEDGFVEGEHGGQDGAGGV